MSIDTIERQKVATLQAVETSLSIMQRQAIAMRDIFGKALYAEKKQVEDIEKLCNEITTIHANAISRRMELQKSVINRQAQEANKIPA